MCCCMYFYFIRLLCGPIVIIFVCLFSCSTFFFFIFFLSLSCSCLCMSYVFARPHFLHASYRRFLASIFTFISFVVVVCCFLLFLCCCCVVFAIIIFLFSCYKNIIKTTTNQTVPKEKCCFIYDGKCNDERKRREKIVYTIVALCDDRKDQKIVHIWHTEKKNCKSG